MTTEKAHAEPKEFPSNSTISINCKHLHQTLDFLLYVFLPQTLAFECKISGFGLFFISLEVSPDSGER